MVSRSNLHIANNLLGRLNHVTLKHILYSTSKPFSVLSSRGLKRGFRSLVDF